MIRLSVTDVAFGGGEPQQWSSRMTTKLLTTVAAAVIVTAGGVALAQEDHNNPAPSYGAMAPVANKNVKHIQDGTNGAPRYAPVTTSTSTSKATGTTATHATVKRRANHG
jgi:hypothetical protein